MDGITNNPPGDLRIAAMPLSEKEQLARRIRQEITTVRVLYSNLMYDLRVPLMPQQQQDRHMTICNLLRNISDEMDKMI